MEIRWDDGLAGVGAVDPQRRQPPLGIMKGFVYRSEPVALAAGEALLLFSDGVTEAEDGHGGYLWQDRLVECLAPVAAAPSSPRYWRGSPPSPGMRPRRMTSPH